MKKIFLSIIVSITIFTSCEKFLTIVPEDSLVADNYYVDEEALRANTASLYGFAWFDYHSNFMWLGGDMLAGDIYYTYEQKGHFFYNMVGAGNAYNNNGWEGLYRVISFANSIINDMPAPARSNNISEMAIEKALGEARFIRASAYLLLAEFWGEVPIIENSTALITSGNPKDIYVNKHIKGDVYRFVCEDLEYSVSKLPEVDSPGRVTSWSAKGMLAKAYLTRAAFEGSAEFYTKAKELAGDVVENSGLVLWSDYATMFDFEANNSSESLFAIQCMRGDYGLGNARNANFARSNRIANQAWGGGNAPTRSLQSLYESGDSRCKWVYMTNDDVYPNFDNYEYKYVYRDPNNTEVVVESHNKMLAHIKKYVIGNHPEVGGSQDAGNNVYLLRLSDVYLIYVEACIGMGSSTSDAKAIDYLNDIRDRASLDAWVGEITFLDLIKERRKEFAFEGINWFDIKRYYYRDAAASIKYLNDMERDKIYVLNYDTDPAYNDMTTDDKYVFENKLSSYIDSWETISDEDDKDSRVNNIVFTEASMTILLPAAVTTKAPILNEPAIAYYND